jgi:signal transduction histidine kinase
MPTVTESDGVTKPLHLDDLLGTLLDVSRTGIILFRPVYAADGTDLIDLGYERLNPVAQRLLRLPEYPAPTFLQLYPAARDSSLFAFYRSAFLADEANSPEVAHPFNIFGHKLQMAARRSGSRLVVSFDGPPATAARPDGHGVQQQVLQLNETLAVYNEELQATNEELAVTNEELQAANEEIRDANTELMDAHQQLRELNQELESRVEDRTQDLRRARAAAVAQHDDLQRVFNQAPLAVMMLHGPHYFVDLSNPALGSLLGRPSERLVGYRLFVAAPDLAGQGLEQLFDAVLQTGEPQQVLEHRLVLNRAHSGQPAQGYFNFSCQPMRNWLGQISGLIVVGAEVTSQVLARQQVQNLNEELAVLNEELQAANEELGFTNGQLGIANHQLTRTNVDLDNFIYTASHDLKAPISNIEGLLTILRKELMPLATTYVTQVLGMMQDSVARFKHTINLLTESTEADGQTPAATPAPVPLAVVVEAVRLDLRAQLAASGGQLDLEPGDCSTAAFSEKSLRSVVYNLLSNALKYRHPARAPHVRLHCQPAGKFLVLAVRDNGLGLKPEQQQQLFGLFQRLHNHVEGSGIGLYMVKKIVENAGGSIEVESEFGVGSTFRVFIPS